MSSPKKTSGRVKLLVGILCKEDEAKFTATVNEFCAAIHYAGIGNGTASNNYLSYFGFREIEKRVVYSLVPEACLPSLLPAVSKTLRLSRAGRGIAFTIPLSSISGILNNALLSSVNKNEIADGKKQNPLSADRAKRKERVMHELVIAVVNEKFTDLAIDAARTAGATGATLFHTRSVDNAKAEQRIGTALRHETDTLFFLTTSEYRSAIMEAVRDAAGLKTEGGAVLFSLPVDDVLGIGDDGE